MGITGSPQPPKIDFNNFGIISEPIYSHPSISLLFNVEYVTKYQVPLSFRATLKSQQGKIVGFTESYFRSDPGIPLNIEPERPNYSNSIASIRSDCHLSWSDVEHLENCRQLNQINGVYLSIMIECAYLNYDYYRNAPSYNVIELRDQKTISHSDWIQKFAVNLGIGDFLLVELSLPIFQNSNSEWYDDIQRSIDVLRRMKDDLLKCDWNDVIEQSRKFWEIFYGKDIKSNAAVQAKRERLKNIFGSSNLSQDGFEALMTSINGMFDFTSKYHHSLDRTHALNPVPNARKENAYFLFTSCVNFLKMIVTKLQ